MPVTIKPFDHDARAFEKPSWDKQDIHVDTHRLLRGSLTGHVPDEFDLFQSSWGHGTIPIEKPIIPDSNGFVNSLILAYNQHHHITLRPDDIWLAILTQFSLFVVGHAEELRHLFVQHEGQEKIRIEYNPHTAETFDFSRFAQDMTHALKRFIIDPDLREWIIPDFTTTEQNDIVVASMVMMGTLQKYFIYECGIICGFPSVTLMGERSDYEKILRRLDRLEYYGAEAMIFATILRPVLKRFMASFDDAAHTDVVQFWRHCLYIDDSTCGTEMLSGWITAFIFWDRDGNSLWRYPDDYGPEGPGGADMNETQKLTLDNIHYQNMDKDDIPPAFVQVPFLMDAEPKAGEMYAGLMGIGLHSQDTSSRFVESDKTANNSIQPLDSVAPVAAWFITESLDAGRKEAERRERRESLNANISLYERWLQEDIGWLEGERKQQKREDYTAELRKLTKERDENLSASDAFKAERQLKRAYLSRD